MAILKNHGTRTHDIFAEWADVDGQPFRTLVGLRCSIGGDNIEIILPGSFPLEIAAIVAIPVLVRLASPKEEPDAA